MIPRPSSVDLPVDRLREEISGQVITPDDADYDRARTLMYGGYDRRPALVIRVAGARDVARAIALGRETGLDLAVKSGGHSLLGHSVSDGGIVIDLSLMKGLEIDTEAGTAWAETGLTAGEMTRTLSEHGLAVPFGDTPSVGIGGITLGGGVGFLVRKVGMTIDSLLAAEVVTADGELVTASPDSHPDLFWAIRGGGGNFGVATRFLFRLHTVESIYGGMIMLPATRDVVAGLVAAAEAAPEELSAIFNVMSAPPLPFVPPDLVGKLVTVGLIAYVGADPVAGEATVAPFRALATPFADMLRPCRYVDLFPPEQGEYHPTVVSTNMFVDRIGPDEAQTIVTRLSEGAPGRVVQLRVLGGAMARVPVDATAFAHRQSEIMVNVASFYDGTPDGLATGRQWIGGVASALRQSDLGAYSNFMQEEGEQAIRAAYPGATGDRLMAVKRRYDPDNLFHLNQNIRPQAD